MADAHHAHGQFCWHEIGTRDAQAAKRFYQELLGWSTEDMPMPGDWGGTYTMARANGGDVAGIFSMDGDHFEGVPAHWTSYVWVDDVDATAGKAAQLGATVMSEPMDIPGIGRMATLQDPTGAVINVFSGTGHSGAAKQAEGAQGGVGWNELVTPDAGAAKDFYTKLFGWDAETGPSPGSQTIEYTTFKVGGEYVGGMMEMGSDDEWKDVPPHWMPYVSVHDCAGCQSKAEGLGGTVHVPATAIPNIGTFAVLSDPTGATFSIMQWAPPSDREE